MGNVGSRASSDNRRLEQTLISADCTRTQWVLLATSKPKENIEHKVVHYIFSMKFTQKWISDSLMNQNSDQDNANELFYATNIVGSNT